MRTPSTLRAAAFTPPGISADITPQRLQAHFTQTETGGYKINKNIRDMIVFAPQNVVKDPPFTKLDLISCRNLLIYFNQTLQKTVIPTFHYSLNPCGILFLGSSESIGSHMKLFSVLDKKWKIFKRNEGITHIPKSFRTQQPERGRQQVDTNTNTNTATEIPNTTHLIETILRESDAPPTVIIDHDYNVLYIHGKTGNYLEPAEGEGCMNLMDMARPDIKTALTSAIRKAFSRQAVSIIHDLPINTLDGPVTLGIHLKPIRDKNSAQGLLLISFNEQEAIAVTDSKTIAAASKKTNEGEDLNAIERELRRTQEALQSTIEEYETSDEELKATNEELQSTNEELQSTNEELETSKEELQSLNEESTTINAELQGRIEGLNQANDDLKNFLDSTETTTLFLDAELKVTRYSPKITGLIPLTHEDIGRPIGHFATKLQALNITENAQQVLNDLTVMEYQVSDDEHTYIARIRPYRKLNNVINGVVITFEDNTERLLTHNRLLRHQSMLNKILGDIDNIHTLKDTHFQYEMVNDAFCKFLGRSQEEIIGKTDAELFTKDEAVERLSIDKEVCLTKKPNTHTHKKMIGQRVINYIADTSPVLDTETNQCVGLISSSHIEK